MSAKVKPETKPLCACARLALRIACNEDTAEDWLAASDEENEELRQLVAEMLVVLERHVDHRSYRALRKRAREATGVTG